MKTFTNPVLRGSYPDPSICRKGDDFYLITSTFEYFPGIPIFHSTDLVTWTQIGHVLDSVSQLDLNGVKSNNGIYASTIRFANGLFYVVTTSVNGGGNYFVTAEQPEGPWSDPIWIDTEGIDPSLFFDDDGKVYYTRHVGLGDGHIGQSELDIKTGNLKGPLQEIWGGTGDVWPEGPHIYKHGGWYYCLIAEGGTSHEHMITVARSKNPMGPYESNPKNPILTTRYNREEPYQSLGHADFVETADGWWTVFLGVVEGKRHLGRQTFIAPVHWSQDGWPEINNGKPISAIMKTPNLPQTDPQSYTIKKVPFGLEWNYLRRPDFSAYSETERPGWIRLYGKPANLTETGNPTYIGQRQTSVSCKYLISIDFKPAQTNEEAGCVIRGNETNHVTIGICRTKEGRQILFRHLDKGITASEQYFQLDETGIVQIRIDAAFDTYSFYFKQQNGDYILAGQTETVQFVYERIQTFIGAYIGMYATGNGKDCSVPADFQFTIETE